MELQDNLATFAKNHIQICAISYDPIDTLNTFAEKFNIAYPLLSDADSAVIRRFGILNTYVPENHPWYGVPFPGTYIADQNGLVTERSFYANHGIRDSVARMLEETFRIDPDLGAVQTLETDSLIATAHLSSATIRRGQVQTFTLQIEPKNNRHLHAQPLPEGYIPTTLSFEPLEGVHIGEITYPEPEPHHLEALNETLHIYPGKLTLNAAVRNAQNENFTLKATLNYQACDSTQCYLPETLHFEIPVTCLDNVRG